MKKYKLAIIGSGPAGLSAGVHAAETGASHILLEKTSQLANTIVKFQKGKHVMDEPRMLPVRSPLPFKAGTRESVLDEWKSRVKASSVNVRYNAEVVSVAGRKGGFTLGLKSGEEIESDNVVLAIGLQGNPRKLGVSGEDLPFVQYGLDDPQAYEGETIVVAGAGDAAIENALALTVKNRVIIVNRRDEFTRAKQANLAAVLKAIETGQISCYYNTSIIRAERKHPALPSAVFWPNPSCSGFWMRKSDGEDLLETSHRSLASQWVVAGGVLPAAGA